MSKTDSGTNVTDDVSSGTALPLGMRRHPRHRRTWLLAAAVTATALMTGGVTAALRTGSAAPSPLAAVTSALARTSAKSYAFSLVSAVRFAGREKVSDAVSGAFDPGHSLGTEHLTARSAGQPVRAQVRFIGAYLYTSVSPESGFGKPWDKSPLTAARGMPPGDLYGFVSDRPVSPAALAVVLRSAGASVHGAGTASGLGWSGTKYTFSAGLHDGGESVSGTVYVDQRGQVRRLVTITTEEGKHTTEKTVLTTARDITFGDFGAPVRVTTPPTSQVKYTSGEPYWGFYF